MPSFENKTRLLEELLFQQTYPKIKFNCGLMILVAVNRVNNLRKGKHFLTLVNVLAI